MSELNDLRVWLNGSRNFNEGLMLYIAYINDTAERNLIEKHRNEPKLFNALRERFYVLKDKQPSGSAVTIQVKPVAVGKEENHDVPQELLQHWGQLKTEQERLHTEMSLIGENQVELTASQMEQRAALAKLVVEREEMLHELSSAINFCRLNGKLPDGFKLHKPVKRQPKKKSVSKMTDSEQILRLKNIINPQLSKLKKKLDDKKAELPKLKGNDLVKANKKLSEWEALEKDLLQEKTLIINAQQ